jgi:metal-dependent amidase/aminoacylase/carboxypeptidase family protein
MPQSTIDPVMKRNGSDRIWRCHISTIHGGSAANIIPDDAVPTGTIRSFKPEVRAKLFAGIERTAKAVAAMSNAPEPEIKITEGIKAVINDPGVVATAEKVLKAAFGDKFRPTQPVTPSQDYLPLTNITNLVGLFRPAPSRSAAL